MITCEEVFFLFTFLVISLSIYNADPHYLLYTLKTNTMSSALIQLIPVLDGANYTTWAHSMEAFLRSQLLWKMA